MTLYELSSRTLAERQRAIGVISNQLRLGDVTAVELPQSLVLASARGEVEYFYASGALWGRDAAADELAENEERKWDGIEEQKDGTDTRLGFNQRAAALLARQATALLSEADLLPEQISHSSVQLDQVAQLDEKGNELRRGVGGATVKFAYAADGVPVGGPGAKTQVYVEPGRRASLITGVFHVWRDFEGSRRLLLPAVQAALDGGLLRDPELVKYHELGHSIRITRLDLIYYALPAFDHQAFLFPAFQVEGTVIDPKSESEFDFGRFHHVAPPANYEAAGARAHYLENIQELWTRDEPEIG